MESMQRSLLFGKGTLTHGSVTEHGMLEILRRMKATAQRQS